MNTFVIHRQNGLRETVKKTLANTLYYSGIAWLSFLWAFRKRGVVLMYHRVLPSERFTETFSADAIVVTPATFKRHMSFLKQYCNPVSADEFSAMLKGQRPWLPRTCLVTFDDGWADNEKYALPILIEQNVPAVIFLATGYVGTDQCFWQERLTRKLFEAWTTGQAASPIFNDLGAAALLHEPASIARESIRHIVTAMKKLSPKERSDIIEKLDRHLQITPPSGEFGAEDRFLSWEQAMTLHRSGVVTLGSHAHSHTPLTELSNEAVREEIAQAHKRIATHLAIEPRTFAYPNGDYNAANVDAVRSGKYELAFTTDAGSVAPGHDPLTLRRMNISERGTTSEAGFLCRLLGWL
jgi:peptidoglycan/xylan/chitin deacetylase (PgdA/CDA1 family)